MSIQPNSRSITINVPGSQAVKGGAPTPPDSPMTPIDAFMKGLPDILKELNVESSDGVYEEATVLVLGQVSTGIGLSTVTVTPTIIGYGSSFNGESSQSLGGEWTSVVSPAGLSGKKSDSSLSSGDGSELFIGDSEVLTTQEEEEEWAMVDAESPAPKKELLPRG